MSGSTGGCGGFGSERTIYFVGGDSIGESDFLFGVERENMSNKKKC